MPSVPLSPSAPSAEVATATLPATNPLSDVVEIGLLLPADWAAELMELSRKRQQSVAQILRSFIGRGLVAAE
jgi:hypothetical protein